MDAEAPKVSVVMGSQSDWEVMIHASRQLDEFDVAHESRIVSAHRTPHRLVRFAEEARGRGVRVLVAGAGGAAHLPGMLASLTILPVFGVPVPATILRGEDSVASILQMPAGVPVGTLAIGKPGAVNAALLAIAVLALSDDRLAARLQAWRNARADSVPWAPRNREDA